MIYAAVEQQQITLFASLGEAKAWAATRLSEPHFTCDVVPFSRAEFGFDPERQQPFEQPPLEAGPGQQFCRRIQRAVHQWWAARDAWWDSLDDGDDDWVAGCDSVAESCDGGYDPMTDW